MPNCVEFASQVLYAHPLRDYNAYLNTPKSPTAHCPGVVDQSRTGAEAARDYFPDSILSVPADLNTSHVEPGSIISGSEVVVSWFDDHSSGDGSRAVVREGPMRPLTSLLRLLR